MSSAHFTNSFGGEFTPEPLDEQPWYVRQFFQEMINVKEKILLFSEEMSESAKSIGSKGTKLKFGYILGKNGGNNINFINAISISDGGDDFIGIYLYLSSMIWRFFHKLYDSGFYKNFDQKVFFQINTGSGGKIFPNLNDGEFGLSGLTTDVPEIYQERISLCFSLTLSWIVHHEYAHIWFGHTDYMEFLQKSEGGIKISPEDNFLIEIYADDRAVVGQIMTFFPIDQDINGLIRIDKTNLSDKDIAYLMLYFVISLSSVTTIFSLKGSPLGKTHPLTPFRRERIFSYADSVFQYDDQLAFHFRKAREFVNSSLAFSLGEAFDLHLKVSHEVVTKTENYDYTDIEKRWNDLSKIMAKFSRGRITYPKFLTEKLNHCSYIFSESSNILRDKLLYKFRKPYIFRKSTVVFEKIS